MSESPRIVARKGASAYRTGNTRAAFELAVEQGADCLELDVQLLADGEVVIYNRWLVNDGSQDLPVADLTLPGLRRLYERSIGSNTDAQLLTLPELLVSMASNKVELLLELKNSGLLQTPALGRRVVEELVRADMVDRSLVFSFDHVLIASMGDVDGLRKGLLYVARLINLEATLRSTGAVFIETRNDFLSGDLIKELHAQDYQVCGWATNEPHELLRLQALGVDMVTTDAPDVARKAFAANET